MRAFLCRFFSDPKGNVAILFALAAVPVIGAMGAAVDYSMASAQRVSMQAAVDATALALAKIMPASQTELDARGKEWFEANMGPSPLTNIQLTISASTGKIDIQARGNYQPELISVLGTSAFPVSAKAEVVWGSTRLRVALALDVTGSMANAGKMTALKTATKNLLTKLKGVAIANGDVYASIIPFSKDVAIAASNYTANWVRWDLWDEVNGTCSNPFYTTKSACDGWSCSKPWYRNQGQCVKYGGTWTKGGSAAIWTPAAHSTWNGCITDRDQDYDTKNTLPSTATPETLFPAEQYSSCPATMMGLTYDWNALNQKVDDLAPVGNTNQAIGMAWAWQSLTGAPFTVPPLDANYTYKQVIILLSDGLNTQDRWYTSASQIDAREAMACTNAKNTGIIIYAVQVNTTGDPTQAVMKNCATDASKFFMLTSASQIITTFEQIAVELANLHLSQ